LASGKDGVVYVCYLPLHNGTRLATRGYNGKVRSSTRDTYHFAGGLEQAVVDLVRVGSTGFPSGVRQLAARLVRSVPPGVADPDGFRAAVRAALAEAETSVGLRFGPGEVPTEEGSAHALAYVDPNPDGDGLVLAPKAMYELQEVVAERHQASALIRAGVGLTRTVLISGQPGVGKSMAARWLAQSMGIPLVSVDLATVVSSFLGTSGRNIRTVLEYAKSGSCVLLLDEFDALAKRRDDDTDIGELKRIVNVILLELDRWPDSNLLVAATNHRHLLDPAVGRRFDRQLELYPPGLDERRAILAHLFAGSEIEGDAILGLAAQLTDGSNGSDLRQLWEASRRRAVLYGEPLVDQFLRGLAVRADARRDSRDRLWLALSDRLDMSTRHIAALAGVSHPTVGAALRRARTGVAR
jgi:hypothetical protein